MTLPPSSSQRSVAPHALRVCRGVCACAHSLLAFDPLPELERVLMQSGWSRFLRTRAHPVRSHHQFRVAVAACPNGCSQPHIADFAVIAARQVLVRPEVCAHCGACVEACAEKALTVLPELVLDRGLCLGCAACVRVCPTQALDLGRRKFRVLVGGKLGRHPRLASELGLFDWEDVPELLRRTLAVFMEHRTGKERLGDVVSRLGMERFAHVVRP